MQRLKEAAEKAKIELSGVTTHRHQPAVSSPRTPPARSIWILTLTRAKFNELTADLVERTMGPVRQALSDAGLTASDLSKVLLVGGSTRIPGRAGGCEEASPARTAFKGINPDECVAIGAAIQGGVLGGDVKGAAAAGRYPAVPGHRDHGRRMHQADRAQHHHPHQEEPDLLHRGRQPDRPLRSTSCRASASSPRDNKTLGTFRLDGIAPAPRGVPQIEVTFDIDANGIVNVSAKDLGTGKEQQITITSVHQHEQGGYRQGREGSRAVCGRG